ncbi:MAG: hypothetical protein AAGI66_08145 [Cyanobacteria bacterium P01_H01_bin.74]
MGTFKNRSIKTEKPLRRAMAGLLTCGVLLSLAYPTASSAQALQTQNLQTQNLQKDETDLLSQSVLKADVKVTVNPLNLRADDFVLNNAAQTVSLSLHNVSVQDVLRALSKQAGFNCLIDESVTGMVSVDWKDVKIRDALATLKSYANLAYSIQPDTLLVASANSIKGQTFQTAKTAIIPLKYANASVLSQFINTTVFANKLLSALTLNNQPVAGSGAPGSAGAAPGATAGLPGGGAVAGLIPMPVNADFHSNSLVVVGSAKDIATVRKHVEVLDRQREMKTWRLSQANALDVASLLSASLFNEGQPALIIGGAGGAGGGAAAGGAAAGGGAGGGIGGAMGIGMLPATLQVTAETIEEGTGTSDSNQSSSEDGDEGIINDVTLRTRVQETQTLQVAPTGPILLPDTRLNTITLLGTAEQIAMAESLMPTFDRKVPQVALDVALIELRDTNRKELGFSSAGSLGDLSFGSNNSNSNTLTNQIFSGTIGRTTNANTPLENIFRFSTNPNVVSSQFAYQLNALASKNKVELLANPTVITTSDNETLISIVDEIIISTSVVQGTIGSPTFTNNIGEAGIILNLLPKVGANNTISLRVRPLVSAVSGTEEDRFGNLITLLSKREAMSQNVQLQDGETFFMGGLINDTNTKTVSSNPVLANLPIVGALARNTNNTKQRSELVIMITPHILREDGTGEVSSGAIVQPNPENTQNALPPLSPVSPFDSSRSIDTYENKPKEQNGRKNFTGKPLPDLTQNFQKKMRFGNSMQSMLSTSQKLNVINTNNSRTVKASK